MTVMGQSIQMQLKYWRRGQQLRWRYSGPDTIDQTTWYELDADEHGNDAVSIEQCDPNDFIDNNTDCDDGDIAVNPDGLILVTVWTMIVMETLTKMSWCICCVFGRIV